jgi:FecR-like protein
MAVQPPLAPAIAHTGAATAAPSRGGCFGRGCGFSCLGCLGVFGLAALLVLGSGYWFLVVQASAAVTAPATLVVFNQPVTVNHNPSSPGESLNAGDEVETQSNGHAAIQFPDGSYVRMSPSTTVQITTVQLQKTGALQTAEAVQKVGRTFVNVQHLAGGATFKVGGHSVSAQVRGTQFEVLVRQDETNLIKVFDGTVTVSGRQTRQVNAGQEIDADANGNLSAVRPIQRDPQDPYALSAQCARAVSNGTTAGTMQTSTGDPISTGQTAEMDYDSSGGVISLALCYPGSFMTLSVIDPNGVTHDNRNGASPVTANIQGPAGRYRAIVRAISVSPAEAFAVAFATNAPCVASDSGTSDTGTIVRYTLSNSRLARSLTDSGVSGVTIQVQGHSPTSARLYYYSDIGGTPISWTIVFYAATPNLGAIVTQVTVRGVNVTTQVLKYIGSYGGTAVSSIGATGFTVDRVYSCAGAGGDTIMVIEGHH